MGRGESERKGAAAASVARGERPAVREEDLEVWKEVWAFPHNRASEEELASKHPDREALRGSLERLCANQLVMKEDGGYAAMASYNVEPRYESEELHRRFLEFSLVLDAQEHEEAAEEARLVIEEFIKTVEENRDDPRELLRRLDEITEAWRKGPDEEIGRLLSRRGAEPRAERASP